MSAASVLLQLLGLDLALNAQPRGERAAPHRQDQVRLAGPEPDVLDVRPRGPRRRRQVGVEDRELVAVVLEEPRLRRRVQLEAVRRGRGVAAGHVALRGLPPEEHEPTAFVRRLGLRVLDERAAHLVGDYHQLPASIDRSTSSAAQKSAERYFQPPSGRMQTTVPLSSSPASFRATWTIAPDETPAKIPSLSTSARRPATESAFETRIFRSSFPASRIGGV